MPPFPLDEVATCTCLRLRKAARRITQIYDQALEPVGLTVSQFSLLAHLVPGVLSVGGLAEALAMDPTTLTRNLRPLEARGLLSVTAGTDDRRRRLIRLSDHGRAALEAAYPHWRTARDGLAARLGPAGVGTLDGVLVGTLAALAAGS